MSVKCNVSYGAECTKLLACLCVEVVLVHPLAIGPAGLPADSTWTRQPREGNLNLVRLGVIEQEGWGDDAADAAAANPHFSHELYKHLSKSARRNLAMVDETIIDYELVEAVIDLIDAQHGPGAVLVFLPGLASLLNAFA